VPRLGTITNFTIKPTAMWAFLCPAFGQHIHQSPCRDLGGPVIPRLGTISKFHDQAYSNVGFFVSGVWPAIHQSPCRDLGGPIIPRLGTITHFTIKPTAMWAFLCPAFGQQYINPHAVT
jgi:hypothetical protein